VRIESGSHKRSHELDGIGVRRIRTFPFLPIPFTTPSFMIHRQLDSRSRKKKWKKQRTTRPGIPHCDWYIASLLLATPTMQISLYREPQNHKDKRCSASNFIVSPNTSDYDSNYNSVAGENPAFMWQKPPIINWYEDFDFWFSLCHVLTQSFICVFVHSFME